MKIKDLQRVWKVTKKPSKKEYFQTVKIVLVGFFIIGFVGFAIEMINQLLLKRFFQ